MQNSQVSASKLDGFVAEKTGSQQTNTDNGATGPDREAGTADDLLTFVTRTLSKHIAVFHLNINIRSVLICDAKRHKNLPEFRIKTEK